MAYRLSTVFNRYDIPIFIGMTCVAVLIELLFDPSSGMLPFAAMALAAVVVSARFIWEEIRRNGSFRFRSPRRRRRSSRREASTGS